GDAITLAEACVGEAPDDVGGLSALRDSHPAAGRRQAALGVAAREAQLGAPAPLSVRVTLALGAEDRAALEALASDGPHPDPLPQAGEGDHSSSLRQAL